MTFLEKLYNLMRTKDIKKNALCKELDINGNSFVNWENRGTLPSAEIIIKLANYFSVTSDYLLGLDDVPNRKTIKLNFEEKNCYTCNSFADFMNALEPTGDLGKICDSFIFRGQSNSNWDLVPKIMRAYDYISEDELNSKETSPYKKELMMSGKEIRNYLSAFVSNDTSKLIDFDNAIERELRSVEYDILKNFYMHAKNIGINIDFPTEKYEKLGFDTGEWLPHDLLEIASLARHHEVPTRLLDWTENIYVALYFASYGAVRKVVNKFNKEGKYDDSGDFSIWLFNKKELDLIINNNADFPFKLYKPKLIQNKNADAQKGLLSYWYFPKDEINKWSKSIAPLDVLLDNFYPQERKKLLHKIKIPISESLICLKEMNKKGYNAATMFPSNDGVAKAIEEMTLIMQAEKIFKNAMDRIVSYELSERQNELLSFYNKLPWRQQLELLLHVEKMASNIDVDNDMANKIATGNTFTKISAAKDINIK